LQYCVAAVAALGAPRPEHFDEACFRRPDLAESAARVTVAADPALTAAYPDHYGARVSLRLADGRTVSHGVRDSLGDPERPLAPDAVFDKARMLMAYGRVPEDRAAQALAAARKLLDEPDAESGFPAALLAPLFGPAR
jgi:2-methylcitrate dehydratase PrpD